jgi:hypothetical protein
MQSIRLETIAKSAEGDRRSGAGRLHTIFSVAELMDGGTQQMHAFFELCERNALAGAVCGEHRTGADDDGFCTHACEPGSLGAEGDGLGRGA